MIKRCKITYRKSSATRKGHSRNVLEVLYARNNKSLADCVGMDEAAMKFAGVETMFASFLVSCGSRSRSLVSRITGNKSPVIFVGTCRAFGDIFKTRVTAAVVEVEYDEGNNASDAVTCRYCRAAQEINGAGTYSTVPY